MRATCSSWRGWAATSATALAEVAGLLRLREQYSREHTVDGRRAAGFHLVLAAAAFAASPGALSDPPG